MPLTFCLSFQPDIGAFSDNHFFFWTKRIGNPKSFTSLFGVINLTTLEIKHIPLKPFYAVTEVAKGGSQLFVIIRDSRLDISDSCYVYKIVNFEIDYSKNFFANCCDITFNNAGAWLSKDTISKDGVGEYLYLPSLDLELYLGESSADIKIRCYPKETDEEARRMTIFEEKVVTFRPPVRQLLNAWRLFPVRQRLDKEEALMKYTEFCKHRGSSEEYHGLNRFGRLDKTLWCFGYGHDLCDDLHHYSLNKYNKPFRLACTDRSPWRARLGMARQNVLPDVLMDKIIDFL